MTQQDSRPRPGKESKDPKTRSKGAVDVGVLEDAWHRMHPLTPFIASISVFVAVAVAVFWLGFSIATQLLSEQRSRAEIFELFESGQFDQIANLLYVVIVSAVLLIILIAQIVYNYVNWRVTAYAVTDAAVWYRTGVFNRKQQHARLERIQSVDITHPLLGRIFGLGRLSIEVAGGSESKLLFGFLKTSELERLRAEILARAAGIYRDSQEHFAVVGGEESTENRRETVGAVAPLTESRREQNPSSATMPNQSRKVFLQTAPERQVFQLTTGRLICSTFLHGGYLTALFIAIFIFIAGVMLFIFVPGILIGTVMSIFTIAFVYLALFWSTFSALFGFKVALSADGIRIYRGLLQTVAQTILPRRIHAVEITQPLLWRKLGWYRIKLLQAGVNAAAKEGNNSKQQTEMIRNIFMPAATKEEALLALWLVLPDLGTDIDPNEVFDQCFITPKQARKNAVQPLTLAQRLFRISPPSAKILDPKVYGRRAVALTDTSLLIRGGWIIRWTTFIPFEHIQSFSVEHGPLQRARGLASIRVHLVPGWINSTIWHLADADALAACREIERRSRIRREAQGPERWLSMLQEEQNG